jgi:hypothetical protein
MADLKSSMQKLDEILRRQEASLRRMTTTNITPYPIPPSWQSVTPNEYNSKMALPPPRMLLAYRLGYSDASLLPFDHIDVVRKRDGVHVVFLVRGNEALLVEDEGLFPSDKLVNQLTLLMPKRLEP